MPLLFGQCWVPFQCREKKTCTKNIGNLVMVCWSKLLMITSLVLRQLKEKNIYSIEGATEWSRCSSRPPVCSVQIIMSQLFNHFPKFFNNKRIYIDMLLLTVLTPRHHVRKGRETPLCLLHGRFFSTKRQCEKKKKSKLTSLWPTLTHFIYLHFCGSNPSVHDLLCHFLSWRAAARQKYREVSSLFM